MPTKCTVCGNTIEDGETTCKFCGAPAPIQGHFSTAAPGSPDNKKLERDLRTRQQIAGIIQLAVSLLLYMGFTIFHDGGVTGLYALSTLAVFVAGCITILRPEPWSIKRHLLPSITLVLCGIFFLGVNILTSDHGTASAALNAARVKVSLICIVLGIVWSLITIRKMHD